MRPRHQAPRHTGGETALTFPRLRGRCLPAYLTLPCRAHAPPNHPAALRNRKLASTSTSSFFTPSSSDSDPEPDHASNTDSCPPASQPYLTHPIPPRTMSWQGEHARLDFPPPFPFPLTWLRGTSETPTLDLMMPLFETCAQWLTAALARSLR